MRPGAGRPLIPALLCTLAGPGAGETGPWHKACAGRETESPPTRDSPLRHTSGGGRTLDKIRAGGGHQEGHGLFVVCGQRRALSQEPEEELGDTTRD